jgi:hypothetical protein
MTTPNKLMRRQDWPLHLERFVAARMAMPFVWGSNDCAIFAADCVHAITGQDPAPAGLRRHTTAKQAYRAIARHGGLSSIATDALGAPGPVRLACVGDVVLVKTGGRDALAICNGSTAMMPSARGLVSVGLDTASHAWRVV